MLNRVEVRPAAPRVAGRLQAEHRVEVQAGDDLGALGDVFVEDLWVLERTST